MTTLRELRENSAALSVELYTALVITAPDIITRRRLVIPDVSVLPRLVRQAYLDDMDRPLMEGRGRLTRWVKANRRKLGGRYTMEMLEWLEDFHEAVAHTDRRVPKELQSHPWLGWYIAMRGNPIEGFPADLSWWCALHRLFLIRENSG